MGDNVQIKGVLFDKDGVLVDFDKTWIAVLKNMAAGLANGDDDLEKTYLEVAGYDPASGRCISGSVWAAGNNDELVKVWQQVGTSYRVPQLIEFIETNCLACKPVPICPVEELQSLFGTLKKSGLALGIATNDFEESATHTMAQFKLAPYLTRIIGYDSVANPKPAADPVVAFGETAKLDSREILVVGDNAHDMEMARAGNAGLAVGVLSGNSRKEELAPLADKLIGDVRGLPEILF